MTAAPRAPDIGRTLSLHSLRAFAEVHHSRWVLVGIIIVTAGYFVSFITAWASGSATFPSLYTDLAGFVGGLVAMALFWRGRVVPAVYVTIATVWLEVHAAIVVAGGSTLTAALPAFPTLVVGAALLLGGQTGWWLAIISSVTGPAAIVAGYLLRGAPIPPIAVHQMVVLVMAVLASALLTSLFLRSFAAVLRQAIENERRFGEEQRLLQEQLQQSQKMEAVGRLAGGVAHDFNNLLTVIGAGAEFLKESRDPDVRALAEEIGSAQERGARLTRQLLAFARRDVIKPRTVDLCTVVHDVAPLMRKLSGAEAPLQLDLAGPAWIVADPGQVEQILLNLVSNARDAMPHGGPLSVSVAAGPDGFVALRVRDGGSGMSEEVRRLAIEPFFTTKPRGKGTGLGLAMVHGIVTQNGGRVEIASEPGHGTTVTILWPGSSSPADRAPVALRPSGETTQASGTVLLVEDDEPARGLIRLQLQRAGYRVLEAHDAPTAEAIAGVERVDLLLTDVVMPGPSGMELARRLRAVQPDLPVLLMSGYLDDPRVMGSGLDPDLRILFKPFRGEELRTQVAEALRGTDGPPTDGPTDRKR
jgi:signal transduction histidine kinase/CheY-like chemotaxis protein